MTKLCKNIAQNTSRNKNWKTEVEYKDSIKMNCIEIE